MYKIEKLYRNVLDGHIVGCWLKARHWLYEKEKAFETYWNYRVTEHIGWSDATEYKLDAYKNGILIRSCAFRINEKGYVEAVITDHTPAAEQSEIS